MANLRLPKDYRNDVDKAAHNLSLVKRTTIHPGLAIPIWSRKCLAGDRITVDMNTLIHSNPLVAQLLGTYKLQASIFFDSDTNYYGWLDNNGRKSTVELLQKNRHRINLDSYLTPFNTGGQNPFTFDLWRARTSPYQIHPGCIWDYAGISAGTINQYIDDGGTLFGTHPLDAGFFLTYLNIWRNYFANDQEPTFPVLQGFFGPVPPSAIAPYSYSELSDLDDLFMEIRCAKDGVEFIKDDLSKSGGLLWFQNNYLVNTFGSSAGLLPCTYLPDMMVNLLNSKQNNAKSVVTVKDNGFDIDTLRFQNKLQRLIDRYDVSGGRFSNWLRTVWGVETRRDMDIPELLGVSQSVIDPSLMSAQSSGQNSEVGDVPIGTFGGNFNRRDYHRKHSFSCTTPGRVMVIVSLVPMVDYSQGIEPELMETAFADDYNPEFAQLGFQKISKSMYSVLPPFKSGLLDDLLVNPFDVEVGKNVAWLRYMTDVNRVHGEFADTGYYNSVVLRRRYSRVVDPTVEKQTTATTISQYIDPLDYQYPFIAQTVKDPNWYLQMSFDVKAYRPIGKRFMPNLE